MTKEKLKTLLKKLLPCKCICEPRGDYGLEGFQLGEMYYYKINPTGLYNIFGKDNLSSSKLLNTDYCYLGCACKRVFKRFFREE